MDVSVVIPTLNRFAPLLATVNQLLHQQGCEFEIIVVDQNSEWPIDLKKEKSELVSHRSVHWITGFSPGVVRARNHAVRISNGEVIVFIDDDVRIEDHYFLKKHFQYFIDSQVSAVVGAELYCGSPSIQEFRKGEFENLLPKKGWLRVPLIQQVLHFGRDCLYSAEVCTFCTCNSSIRKKDFFAIGGFDEQFVGNSYGDDYDLAIRLSQSGRKILYSPAPWLIHLQLPSGGLRLKDRANKFSEYDKCVSPLLFFFRYVHYGVFWELLYKHVARKTLLRRDNIIPPWKIFAALLGFLQAMPIAFLASRKSLKPLEPVRKSI